MRSFRVAIQSLWAATREKKRLSIIDRVFWTFLLCCEPWYRFFFKLVSIYKRRLNSPYRAPWPVVSVGNISVGGTGKSVFVSFLAEKCLESSAIFLRGYGGIRQDSRQSFMLSDGKHILKGGLEGGDEALMLAQKLTNPIIVGPSRALSCKYLEQVASKLSNPIKTLILDDGYQHYSLHKDLEIVLLDARHPFENNHCLPAGRLREKDLSRAHIIVFTHANALSAHSYQELIVSIKKHINRDIPILAGKHSCSGLFLNNKDRYCGNDTDFFACAGIGSWSGFITSLQSVHIYPRGHKEYEDHHSYSREDIEEIFSIMEQKKIKKVITTEKDWCKIELLLSKYQLHDRVSWYVLRVEFAFLSQVDSDTFASYVKRCIATKN